MQNALLGVLKDTRCTAGLRCDTMFEHTHDECCDMLLYLGVCYTPAGAAAREYALRYLYPD
jgi:hypothetical protein